MRWLETARAIALAPRFYRMACELTSQNLVLKQDNAELRQTCDDLRARVEALETLATQHDVPEATAFAFVTSGGQA